MTKPTLQPHAYGLAVHDIVGSTAYFVDALGFSKEWNDEHNWQGLVRDGVRLMLGRFPHALAPSAIGDHSYFGLFATEDVDRLHAEFKERGAQIISAPADKPWRSREMAVATPE